MKEKQELIEMYETLGSEITYGYCVANDFKYQNSNEPNAKELSAFYSTMWRCLRVEMTVKEAICYFETGDFELKKWEVYQTVSLENRKLTNGYAVRVFVNKTPVLIKDNNGKCIFSTSKDIATKKAKQLYKERRIEKPNFEIAKKFLKKQ